MTTNEVAFNKLESVLLEAVQYNVFSESEAESLLLRQIKNKEIKNNNNNTSKIYVLIAIESQKFLKNRYI